MAEVYVRGLSKRFRGRPPVVAVDDVSLEVEPGEMLVLLGPSGCGKSTILRCLAGLEEPNAGIVTFGDRSIFDADRGINVPPYRRGIGMVFQAFALWPHLTARKNIAFPLSSMRVPRQQRAELVVEVAKLVDLDDELLDKRPGQLSGGQQQRVALARALIGKPEVILFDEPLSNLDALLREQLRTELRRLHQRLGFTGVYVTHDLLEALSLGDRVAVMRNGAVEQAGRPAEVFTDPANGHVARLLGYRPICRVELNGSRWHGVDCLVTGLPDIGATGPTVLRAFARPDRLQASAQAPEDSRFAVADAVVEGILDAGSQSEFAVRVGDQLVRVPRNDGSPSLLVGDRVTLTAARSDVRLYDADGVQWPMPETEARP